MAIVPPAFRHQATIRKLTKFTMEEIEEILRRDAERRKTA